MSALVVPDFLDRPTTKEEVAANVAHALYATTGSVLGKWSGKVPAVAQRLLFGTTWGRGTIHLDGVADALVVTVKTDYGRDSRIEATANLSTGKVWTQTMGHTSYARILKGDEA